METNYEDKYKDAMRKLEIMEKTLNIYKSYARLESAVINVHTARESKIDRQRDALNKLNRRVRVQRLQLRKLNELERGLRKDEWLALKEEFAHELAEDQWEIEE